ncbi:MAG TPA: DUF6682 family protein [Patescibacteria group bacterium]|nr:DUF6682 family protein [Patescibacteria group bacterium]
MLVSDIATRVRNQFGDDAGVQIDDAKIMRWINDAMREIALNNSLLEVKATTAAVKDQSNYGLPTNMLALHTIRYDGVKLKKVSIAEADDLFENAGAAASGTPRYFWKEASDFILYPKPDNNTSVVTIVYTRVPVEVTAVGNTPELPVQYHNRIVEYCIAQAAELDDNPQLAQMKMQQFEGKTAATKQVEEEAADFYPSITVSTRDSGWDD